MLINLKFPHFSLLITSASEVIPLTLRADDPANDKFWNHPLDRLYRKRFPGVLLFWIGPPRWTICHPRCASTYLAVLQLRLSLEVAGKGWLRCRTWLKISAAYCISRYVNYLLIFWIWEMNPHSVPFHNKWIAVL